MSLSRLISTFRKKLALDHRSRNRRLSPHPAPSIEVLTTRDLLSATTPFPLSSLNATNGFRIDGATESDNSGMSVSSAGDVNGDGFDDIFVGTNNGGGGTTHPSYVVFGKSGGFTSTINLGTLDGTNGFRLDGGGSAEQSVSGGGDVNGDGFDDLIIGAPDAIVNFNRVGSTYVVFGKSGGFSSAVDLSTLNGTNGFRLDGVRNLGQAGISVSFAGDVNGDGFDDIIMGAPLAAEPGVKLSGSSYVYFGKSGTFSSAISLGSLDGTNGFRLNGLQNDTIGNSVSSAGDVNGDGFDDLIIGAENANSPGVVSTGAAYVVFGKSGGFAANFALSGLDGSNGFRVGGTKSGSGIGTSVSSAGDVNGDGFDDLIIGTPNVNGGNDVTAGSSFVVFGKSGGFGPALALDLTVLDGTNGFRIDGDVLDSIGDIVSDAGDVNGDGFDDLLLGAKIAGHNAPGTGSSYVVFGKAGGFAAALKLSSLDGTSGFRLDGVVPAPGVTQFDRSGTSVSNAGDVNGDGFDDFVIGAPNASPDGKVAAGSSYVVFGGNFTGGSETKVGTSAGETLIANRGPSQRDVLIGGRGNDSLISDGGSDVLIGGEGDDILVIPDSNFTGTRRLLGGAGKNTLRLNGSGLILDLPAINDSRLVDIDEIDITGSGVSTLRLNVKEVLGLSSHSNSLIVRQDVDDIIEMGTGWIESGFEIIAGRTFKVLTQGVAELKVQVQGHAPSVTNAVTNEDVQTSSGLVISRNAADGSEVSHFRITDITGGTLFQNDGTSPINEGDFITFAQGNAGLKFTPATNSFATGHFTVQSSLSNADSGLSGTPVIADILVSAVPDTPSVTNAFTFTNTQTFTGPVINRNAADGSEVTHFKITGITGGVLFQNDGISQISNGNFITFAQANAGLKFTPTLNSVATGQFTVQASTSSVDAGLGGSTVTGNITVDAPPGVPSVTNATTSEDMQTTSGLVISRNSFDGAEVTHFRITGITGGELFQNDGVTQIDDGDFITSADAGAGLKFTPSPDFFGTGHFTVQAAISNEISGAGGETVTAEISVDAVADTLSVSNAVTNINSQTTSGLVISRNVSDSAEVTHFRITEITGGTLFQNNGTSPINNGDFITFVQANAGLKFTPNLDSTSTGHFTIQSSIGNTESGLGGNTVTADITLRPAVPVVTGPAAVTQKQRPTISWQASPGAINYIVSVRRHAAGGEQVLLKAVSGTSYTPTTDLGLGRFSIRVRAVSSSGVSSPYSTDRIVRISTPVVFEDVTRFQSTPNAGLSWIPLNGAVKYDLWINNLTTGQSEVVREVILTGTRWNSMTPLPMGEYRVWIRGIDGANVPSTWSKAANFFVLPTVQVTSALSNTFDTTPTFSWSPVEGAIGYDLYLRNLTTGKIVSSPKNIVGTSFTQPTNLDPGDYRWSVFAVSQGSYRSQAATAQNIEIGRLPEILSPDSDTTETTPLFSWTSVGGAATYHLYVTRVDVINRGIIDVSGITGTSLTADPLPIGSYRAWVRAVSASGEISAWNLHYEFSISVETVDFSTVPEQLLQTQLATLDDLSLNDDKTEQSTVVGMSGSAARTGEVHQEYAANYILAADRTTQVAILSNAPPAIPSLYVSPKLLLSNVNSIDAMMADAESVMTLLEI